MPSQTFDTYPQGLLRREHPRATPPAFVREALNVVAARGRWRSRPGVRPFTAAKSAGVLRGLHTHYRVDGTRDFLSAAAATIQRNPPYGDPVTLALTSMPSTEQTRVDPTEGARFISISGTDGLTFIYDGVNPNMKWDGTALTKMGLPKPTNAPAAPSAIGGSVNPGQRNYAYTLWTPYHESEPSPLLTVTQAATGGKRFASPVNGVDFDDPQVTRWKLYATQAGGAQLFLIGKADLTVSIDHTVADNALGPVPLEQLVNDPPWGKFFTLVEHTGIVFGVDVTDRNLVRFCHSTKDYVSPEGWPFGNTVPVAHGDGDEIQILASFGDQLVVFKRKGIWSISGDLNSGFDVNPVLASGGAQRTGIGCIAAGAVIHLENEIIFPSRDGFYVIERGSSFESQRLHARKLSNPIDALYQCSNFALGAAASYDRKRQVYIYWSHG